MNDYPSLSPTVRIQDTGSTPQSYFTGVVERRRNNSDAAKERALRLYEMGELNAAAQLLADLAARRRA